MPRPRPPSCLLPCLLATACDPAPAPAPPAATESPALAKPPQLAAPDGTADPRYATALEQGRQAFAAKDFAAAVAAFERALERVPDDPRALSELGWAAFQAGDLERADRVLTRAAEVPAEPKLAAASLYNLGRVREAQARADEAAALYERSLALRERKTVRARLARLRPAAPKAQLDIEPLDGPHATLAAWCEAHARGAELRPDFTMRCDESIAARPGLVLQQPALDAAAGILEARFVATDDDDSGFVQHHLALRTDAGWFVRPGVGTDGDGGVGNVHATLSRLSFEAIDLVPGGGPELIVRVDERWLDLDMGDDIAHEDERSDRMFCGVGPSGQPACTSPIPLVGALRELPGTGKGPPRSEQTWTLRLRVGTRKVVIGGDAGAIDDAHRAWLGTHAIAFP